MAESTTPSGKVLDRRILRRLLAYVRPYRARFLAALSLTLMIALLSPARPWLVQLAIDQEVAAGDMAGLRTMVLLILGILMLESVIMYRNTYLTNWLGQSIIRDIRRKVFGHLLSLRLQYYDKHPIGMLQTRTINDVETLNDVFSSGLVRILGESLQFFAIVGFMLYVNWELTLVVLTTIPLMIIATWIFRNKVKVAFTEVRKAVSQINSFVQEHLSGMAIVHIFSREKVEFDRFDQINDRLQVANVKSVLYYSIFFPVVELIAALALAALVWYGAGQVVQQEVTGGELVAFIMYTQLIYRPIRLIADQFNTLQLGMVSAGRIFQVLDTEQHIPDTGELTELPGEQQQVSIEFKGVSFAYNEPEWVLKDVSFAVGPGEKAALVGATGSGKTTIINLISRFYDIQEGEILINGVNARRYQLDFLRGLSGVVLQDVFLFSGSIHDNITLNDPTVPRERVIEAAEQVGAHGFISRLPGDYDYQVQERGATLSLGQRQLIAFARVMVYDPRVLILDEATANIDTESEEVIQQAIDTVLTGRTSIIIAHRLSTIQKADQIIVLQKGKLIEKGSHLDLLAAEGAYYQLHQMQFMAEG